MELIIIITFCTLTFFGGICVGAVLSSMPDSLAPHIVRMEESFQPWDEIEEMERTDYNVEIIGRFMEHYKSETGKEIPESVFNSFFNV